MDNPFDPQITKWSTILFGVICAFAVIGLIVTAALAFGGLISAIIFFL